MKSSKELIMTCGVEGNDSVAYVSIRALLFRLTWKYLEPLN